MRYRILISDDEVDIVVLAGMGSSTINNIINKSLVAENHPAEFIVFKQKSKNPYLSIINRSNAKDILYIINKDMFYKY